MIVNNGDDFHYVSRPHPFFSFFVLSSGGEMEEIFGKQHSTMMDDDNFTW